MAREFKVLNTTVGPFGTNYYVVDNNGYHYCEPMDKEAAEVLRRNFAIVYKEGFIQGTAAERNKDI